MAMRPIYAWLVLLLGTVTGPAIAAPQRIDISPPTSEVAFRAYRLGVLPIDGRFTRFSGWLSLDPADRSSCRVELQVEVGSLKTDDPAVLPIITGAQFMDAASFPALRFVGNCQGHHLGGVLAMHGVSRSCELSLDWHPDSVIAEGHIVRADWGISAMPVLAGRTVRIRVSVPLAAQPSHRE